LCALQQPNRVYQSFSPGVSLSWLRLPVLLLYGLFFFVQVFFNFDISAARQLAGGKSAGKYAHATVLVKRIGHCNKTVLAKFRLNKRFHPSAAPAIAEFKIASPEQPIVREARSYQDPFHNDPNSNSTSQRGPPMLV
jgi:hypothetical protein